MVQASYTVGTALPPHKLQAHNEAVESENLIHDDTVAAQYGFKGGLVPGVSVYGYMTYPIVQAFGAAWLTRGTARISLVKPFYAGDDVMVTATTTAVSETEVSFDLRGTNADSVECGVGSATMPTTASEMPAADVIPAAGATKRIPVSWDVVVVGEPLPSLTETLSQAEHEVYCSEHSDDLELYRGPTGYIHPGWLLQRYNRVFANRFILNPWIHVSSDVKTYRACRVGDELEVRGIIIDKFERKGHYFARIDNAILANGKMAQRVTHTAIFQPRRADAE